jgi:hypothetical protein
MTDVLDKPEASCGTCVFFKPPEDSSRKEDGTCRRHPPSAAWQFGKNDLGRVGVATQGVFPTVKAVDWCGEYRLQ